MPVKVWTFSLDSAEHAVEFEYDLMSAKETFTVDGEVIFSGTRWSFTSDHAFRIGHHECRAVLSARRFYRCDLAVDGEPVEMLASNRLLRPAQGQTQGDGLLRPAGSQGEASSSELLRPASEDGT
jgi:hypothetical protein